MPAKPTRSSGSPVIRPRVKLPTERWTLAASALARSTFAASAGIDRHVAIAGELEEALGEVGVIGGKRGIDLARGDRRIERARDGAVGERHRIVLLGQQLVRLEAAREDRQRGDRQGHGQAERQCDPRSGHPVLSSSRPP